MLIRRKTPIPSIFFNVPQCNKAHIRLTMLYGVCFINVCETCDAEDFLASRLDRFDDLYVSIHTIDLNVCMD